MAVRAGGCGTTVSAERIGVLVVATLFPRHEGDVRGTFVLDYVRCISSTYRVSVLNATLIGCRKGYSHARMGGAAVHRWARGTARPGFLRRVTGYVCVFIAAWRIGSKLRDIDVVHAHGSVLSGWMGLLLAWRHRVPLVLSEHQAPFSMISNHRMLLWLSGFVMRRSARVLPVSGHLLGEIRDAGIRPRQVVVTGNPVDVGMFVPGDGPRQRRLLFVGRLDEYKGALRSLQAFHALGAHEQGWSFVIMGDGEEGPVIDAYLAAHPDLAAMVRRTGALQKRDIAALMADASFLVFPSRFESFGIVVVEAFACGLPVLAGDNTSLRELVPGDRGLRVKQDDPEDLRRGMREMMDRCDAFDRNALRAFAVEQYGFSAFGAKLKDIYEEVTGGVRHRGHTGITGG